MAVIEMASLELDRATAHTLQRQFYHPANKGPTQHQKALKIRLSSNGTSLNGKRPIGSSASVESQDEWSDVESDPTDLSRSTIGGKYPPQSSVAIIRKPSDRTASHPSTGGKAPFKSAYPQHSPHPPSQVRYPSTSQPLGASTPMGHSYYGPQGYPASPYAPTSHAPYPAPPPPGRPKLKLMVSLNKAGGSSGSAPQTPTPEPYSPAALAPYPASPLTPTTMIAAHPPSPSAPPAVPKAPSSHARQMQMQQRHQALKQQHQQTMARLQLQRSKEIQEDLQAVVAQLRPKIPNAFFGDLAQTIKTEKDGQQWVSSMLHDSPWSPTTDSSPPSTLSSSVTLSIEEGDEEMDTSEEEESMCDDESFEEVEENSLALEEAKWNLAAFDLDASLNPKDVFTLTSIAKRIRPQKKRARPLNYSEEVVIVTESKDTLSGIEDQTSPEPITDYSVSPSDTTVNSSGSAATTPASSSSVGSTTSSTSITPPRSQSLSSATEPPSGAVVPFVTSSDPLAISRTIPYSLPIDWFDSPEYDIVEYVDLKRPNIPPFRGRRRLGRGGRVIWDRLVDFKVLPQTPAKVEELDLAASQNSPSSIPSVALERRNINPALCFPSLSEQASVTQLKKNPAAFNSIPADSSHSWTNHYADIHDTAHPSNAQPTAKRRKVSNVIDLVDESQDESMAIINVDSCNGILSLLQCLF